MESLLKVLKQVLQDGSSIYEELSKLEMDEIITKLTSLNPKKLTVRKTSVKQNKSAYSTTSNEYQLDEIDNQTNDPEEIYNSN